MLETANEKLLSEIKEREKVADALSQTNDDLISSVNYALKIQEAILPSQKKIAGSVADAFVFSINTNFSDGLVSAKFA